jgi:hypothetical protein
MVNVWDTGFPENVNYRLYVPLWGLVFVVTNLMYSLYRNMVTVGWWWFIDSVQLIYETSSTGKCKQWFVVTTALCCDNRTA